MKSSILRTCRPRAPLLNCLTRQSRDPARTRYYAQVAAKERDESCFPRMLRVYTHRVRMFRLVQRLWIPVLYHRLNEDDEIHHLTSLILSYVSFRDPKKFYKRMLRYNSLNLSIRFQQMSGKLVTLGQEPLVIPTLTLEDVEYKIYMKLWQFEQYRPFPRWATALYRQLKQKGIQDAWRIMLSHLKPNHFFDKDGWKYHCESQHAQYFLEECIQLNPQADLELLRHWTDQLKYPSLHVPDSVGGSLPQPTVA
jgi:hypothetical protein